MRADPVVFQRVHASDAAGPFGRPRGRLVDFDLGLGPGVHAFVGAPEDGTIALTDILTGVRAPIRGRVIVGGREPYRSPTARARIGALTWDALLPDAATVGAAIQRALVARGEAGHRFDAVLDPFGLSPLHARGPTSLSLAERRAVELAIALSTSAPRLLVLHEPFVDVAITLPEIVHRRVRDVASAGASVVVATSSPADAVLLADQIYLLKRGRAVAATTDGTGGLAPSSAELLVHLALSNDFGAVRALVATLAHADEIGALAWESSGTGARRSTLRIGGKDLDACAVALASGALAADVAIDSIAYVAPPLVAIPTPPPGHVSPTVALPNAPRPFGAPSVAPPSVGTRGS